MTINIVITCVYSTRCFTGFTCLHACLCVCLLNLCLSTNKKKCALVSVSVPKACLSVVSGFSFCCRIQTTDIAVIWRLNQWPN